MTTRAAIPTTAVPPLEPGDHLTRDEFERRYEAMPEHIKAELIEGVVYMAPPAVRWDYHGSPYADLIGWLVRYRASTRGVRVGDNSSIRLDLDNEPQPDAAMVDIQALMNDDPARALGVLEEGIASPEHAEFVDLLKSRRTFK